MTTNKTPKSKPKRTPKSKSKPLHIEVHGDGIDVVATFQGNKESGLGRKEKANAWAKLIQLFSSAKIGSASQPTATMPTPIAGPNIEDVVYVIRVAPQEDIDVIIAALRARATWDARDAAKTAATNGDVTNGEVVTNSDVAAS